MKLKRFKRRKENVEIDKAKATDVVLVKRKYLLLHFLLPSKESSIAAKSSRLDSIFVLNELFTKTGQFAKTTISLCNSLFPNV